MTTHALWQRALREQALGEDVPSKPAQQAWARYWAPSGRR
jgi:hypothetical protein